MADLSITAANVAPGSRYKQETVTAGEAITRGQAVYRDTADANEFKLSDASALASVGCDGIALNDAADGQPLTILTSGDLNPGATLEAGEMYVVSATAGAIAPVGDLVSGNYTTILGIATTTSNLKVNIFEGGTARSSNVT